MSIAASTPLVPQTLADRIQPLGISRFAYNAMLVIGGSLLTALCAQIAIPLWPVPITGQTFAVLLVGALLGSKRGMLAMMLYAAEGAMGLPVFAGFSGGFWHLFGPTGGYIIGFIPAAFIVGLLAERGWDRREWTTALAMTIGTLVVFAFGVPWLWAFTNFFADDSSMALNAALVAGFYPFLPGAALKIALAMVLLPLGWRLLGKR